jgi:hypothetical protein
MSATKRPSPSRQRADLMTPDRQQMGEVLALRKAFFKIMGAPNRALRPKRISSETRTNGTEAPRE